VGVESSNLFFSTITRPVRVFLFHAFSFQPVESQVISMKKTLAAVFSVLFFTNVLASGYEPVEECAFYRFYVGSAGTIVLPQGGSDIGRLGGGALRAGYYLTEFWAVEAEAALLENAAGYGARVLWHWWGYERFDPFFTGGAKGFAGRGCDEVGPALGVGAFYHLTDRVSLRFDAESMLALDDGSEVDYSLAFGIQWYF
jgi:hypothetical protein